ncbi:hypothetical protein E8E11_007956 [Didymella keratinophila]|nr:hypothetical protein E8E11_007956 [Didymella keratinophila]
MKSVRILGLRNQEEQDQFMKSWSEMSGQWHDPDHDYVPEWPNTTPSTDEELRERHKVTFGEEGDPWSQWKRRDM